MRATLRRSHLAVALSLALAQSVAAAAPTKQLEQVQVTATRIAESVDVVPASITVITAEDMRDRGANDLRSALALVAGVEISPGGDSGPAGAVPAIWGLREFDAFLLVVDGVPYGGAFNPQLTTLNLNNVERIEVLRGAAPVMYGATSFVGVIHVIHYAPGSTPGRVNLSYGSYGSVAASAAMDIGSEAMPQSLAVDGEFRDFKDDDAEVNRGHLLYRLATDWGAGRFGFDADVTVLRQQPLSPSPRAGRVLDPLVPIDANHNPADAKLDEDRYQFTGRYDQEVSLGDWSSTLSYAHTRGDFVRGFLAEGYASNTVANANGYTQDRDIDDLYFDTHISDKISDTLNLTYGADWLYGKAELDNEIFNYFVPLNGSARPNSSGRPVLDAPEVEDKRSFLGAYVQADWEVNAYLDVLAGLRVNHTREDKDGETDTPSGPIPASDERTKTRLGGVVGASVHVWRDGEDSVTVYADARDTYKPAALDFGPDGEADVLEPETATSYEIGAKGALFNGAFEWDVSAFRMNFENLVVSQPVNGLPTLVNAGSERFKGAEFEATWHVRDDLRVIGNWAWHDARFGDFVQLFGNTPTQLRGKKFELAPDHLAGLGLIYAPEHGFQAAIVGNYVGNRYLNKRNTAPADPYTTVDASLGYHWGHYDVRLNGYNLSDRRDAISESEIGDAQYYRLPARALELSVGFNF